MIDSAISAILAAGTIGVLFCYAQMRYHQGVYDGLVAAEKMYRDSMKGAQQVGRS